MATLYTIDGVTVKAPSGFSIERYNLTDSGRVASGKMMIDLIAKKVKLNFSYDVISGKDLDTLLSVIDSDKMLFPVTYVDNGTTKTITVYAGAIKATKWRTDGVWYWKDVSFALIQQ